MENEIKLSVSKCKTFSDCAKKFKFSYIEKLPKKEWEHHTLGKFCHKVLEDFHNAYIIQFSQEPFNIEMSKAWKAAIIEYKDGLNPEMKKECWNLINQYLKIVSDDKKNNTLANVIACEKDFSFKITDQIILNGMIDRVQIDPDNVLHLADYKTTKNKKYLKNDWFQLLTYCYVMLMEDSTISKIRVSYILLRHDFEYITTEFKTKEILGIKDKYIEYANKIASEKEYKATPTALCSYCDFLDLCVEGQQKSNPFNSTKYGEVSW